MDAHPAIEAAVDQETAHIRKNVADSTAALLELQLLVGKNMARFVAQECLERVGKLPESMSMTTKYQILLAHLYAWQKEAS